MKIIIIDYEPYSKRREKHFFVEDFRSKGWKVEFWCMQLVFPSTKNVKYTYKEQAPFVYYLKTEREFRDMLALVNKKETFIFLELFIKYETLFVYKILNKYNYRWGRLNYYSNPTNNFLSSPTSKNIKTAILSLSNKLSILLDKDRTLFILFRLFRKSFFQRVITSQVSFVTGTNRSNLPPSNKFISIDYFDVVEFKLEKQKPPLLNYPYIVFSDIYLGKHPDLQAITSKPYLDQESYYDKLDVFFSDLEKALKMPVVIAAHPKSQYTDEFKGRLCIKDHSANLIINSKLFLQHCSLSISFALLSEKKIISFYYDSFKNNPILRNMYNAINNITSKLDGISLDIDSDYDLSELLEKKINSNKYKKALHDYFTKDDSESSNFETVSKYIENLLIKKENN